MGPYDYVVERIDGDYAFLRRTDEEVDDLMQVARALLYPASDPGHTSAQWDGALCFLQLLQVLFDAERTCLL